MWFLIISQWRKSQVFLNSLEPGSRGGFLICKLCWLVDLSHTHSLLSAAAEPVLKLVTSNSNGRGKELNYMKFENTLKATLTITNKISEDQQGKDL